MKKLVMMLRDILRYKNPVKTNLYIHLDKCCYDILFFVFSDLYGDRIDGQ